MNVALPSIPIEVVAVVLLAFIAGLSVPTYYGVERMQGFGRWFLRRLPYEPPPGRTAEEQLEQAAEEDAHGGEDG
jgi:hypothetical protein